MKADEILKLVDAGFSKDEILKMTSEEPVTDEKPAAAEKTLEPDQAQQLPNGYATALDNLLEKFNSVLNDIKLNNVQTARMETQPEKLPEELLAEIIAPPGNRKEK